MRSFIGILSLFFCLAACNEQPRSEQQPQPLHFDHTIYLDNKPIKVAVFDTHAEREKGLMWVKSLPKDQGALFVFEQEGTVAFWMKKTQIQLDILFFDQHGVLVKSLKNLNPCATDCPIYEAEGVKYVLELPTSE